VSAPATACGPAAEQVTRGLGFDCHHVSTVVSVRAPWDLAHWSMPLLELLIVGGAVFALVHARRRYAEGDPVNLALWFTSLVYLFVTEPPLYFPEWFGLDKQYGFIFAHNRFTVQFMGDRLPLYIVAFYPVISQLAYELVRSLGIFRKRGPATGAIAVAFACQVFYEVFDQIGPQLKWWAWNPDNLLVNHPMMASVPMNSVLLFASVSMGAMTYLVVRLSSGTGSDGRPRHGRSLALRILLAGVLTPPTMAIAGIPSSFFGGDHPDITAQAWILGTELALVWLAGAFVVVREYRSGDRAAEPLAPFARYYPALYLGAMALFWVTALPAYLDAKHGITSDGTPTGSGLYALACFAGAALVLAAMFRTHRSTPVPDPQPRPA
jgi:hypothetical protein